MAKLLSPDAIERYRRDGYHFPVPVLTAAEARSYRDRLEIYERQAGGPISANMRHKTHLLFTWASELIRHPAILDAVEDLIGPDILCWSTSFFIKEPRSSSFVSWHQDATYWGLSSDEVVTAWIALTPSTPETGCLRVVPGSQARRIDHRDTFDRNNLLSRGQEIAVEVDERHAVDIVLAPGQMSLHHVLIVHGSAPNRGADWRIGFTARYIPTRLKQLSPIRDTAMLVRGTDRHGHFELEPRPAADFAPEAVAYHREVQARLNAITAAGAEKPMRTT
jgi:chlorinating enzyme